MSISEEARVQRAMERSAIEAFRALREAGKMALRGIFLLNAGGAVALLAFLAQQEFHEAKEFILPVFVFGLGAASAVIAACLVHYSYVYYHNTLLELRSENYDEVDRMRSIKKFFQRAYISFAIIGGVIFLVALSLLYSRLSNQA